MKKWFVTTGIVILIFVGGYLAFSFYAVKFIEARVHKMIGPGVTMAQIRVKITHLSLQGIRFEDPRTKQEFLKIEEMRVYPDVLAFLKRRLHIREWVLLRPYFFFCRTQEGVLIGPWISTPTNEKRKEVSGREERKEREAFLIRVDCIKMEKGSIDFDDMKIGQPPGQIRLRDLVMKMKNIEYPLVSFQSPIELEGKIKGDQRTGEIALKGWFDLMSADTEASLKIREVELKTFEPYYRQKVSAEIESGYVNLDAQITIKGKGIDTPVKLEVSDFRIKEEGTVFYIPAKTLRYRLKEKGNRLKVQFHVKGRLDDPRFNLPEAFLIRAGIGLGEAIGLPIKAVGTRDLDEGVGLVEGLFKKKEKQ